MQRQTPTYDVIVAGSGPGGASAAYYLGEAGLKVLVLEKEDLPRYKTCGGGVSIRTLEKYFPFSFDPVIECRARSLTYAMGKETVQIPLAEPSMVTVMRDRFDAFILEHARAEVITRAPVARVREEPERVVVETRGGQAFTARYLIGADGANSTVARAVGLRRGKRSAAAVEAEIPAPPHILQQFQTSPAFLFGDAVLFGGMRFGYGWIFPKADHLSVGAAILRPKPGEIQAALRRITERYGLPLDAAKVRGHALPLHLRREPIATRRVLLVGDAAGLVDAVSGEGIRMAIKSARIATQAIAAGEVGQYARQVDARIGRDLRLSVPLGVFFYGLRELCFPFGVRNPLASQAFMDQLSDDASTFEVIVRLFGTMPVYLLTEAGAAVMRGLGKPERAENLKRWIYENR